jgi:hypothetical protein
MLPWRMITSRQMDRSDRSMTQAFAATNGSYVDVNHEGALHGGDGTLNGRLTVFRNL